MNEYTTEEKQLMELEHYLLGIEIQQMELEMQLESINNKLD